MGYGNCSGQYQAACRHRPVAFKGVYGVCFALPQGLVNLSAFHKHFMCRRRAGPEPEPQPEPQPADQAKWQKCSQSCQMSSQLTSATSFCPSYPWGINYDKLCKINCNKNTKETSLSILYELFRAGRALRWK